MEKRILVVEDEPDIREAIVQAISDADPQFVVFQANDGRAGLDVALREHPDLILLDLVMPVMDGNEMLEKLRDDPWGHTARVVILSAMDDVTNIATSHEHNITDYIIKSHTGIDEMLQKVRLALHTDS